MLEKFYAVESGEPDPHPTVLKDELAQSIAGDYILFGLAKGPQSAAEMVRQLQKSAAELARADQGPSR